MEILKTKVESKGYTYNRGMYCWHEHASFKDASGQIHGELIISDCAGGCGMQQLYGWSGVSSTELANALVKKAIETLEKGVGLVICQVGQPYYNGAIAKALESNGFVILSELPNYRHCAKGTYKQRLYGLTIKRESNGTA